MKRLFTLALCICFALSATAALKGTEIISPDGSLKAEITVSPEGLSYSLSQDGVLLLKDCRMALKFTDQALNKPLTQPRIKKESIDETIKTLVYKKADVKNQCNKATLAFKYFTVELRAYNDGFAYRFVSNVKKPFQVESELAQFRFADDYDSYIPYVDPWRPELEHQLHTSFEQTYTVAPVSKMREDLLAFLPVTVCGPDSRKICITETDLYDYPGMYLRPCKGQGPAVEGFWAQYPTKFHQGGHHNLQWYADERNPYLATYQKDVNLPWRIINVAREDRIRTDNDLSFILASGQRSDIDFSFVKPGKVAWDWWNDWNLYNVDFKAGINNQTYKYYIDFASKYGIEYVILDEGWTTIGTADLHDVVPEIDVRELVDYGKERGVGIVLWAGYAAFKKDMEEICRKYSEMGVKGFKVDFMDSDDQTVTNFHYKVAELAARYGLMIDFHGTFKPVGLHRTFPNVVNYEGVHGLEQMKWTRDDDQVTYDVTLPFTRGVAGPMDYTQGAMHNAAEGNYHPSNSEPMSQGTRCHQLGMYVVFESPFSMLCDSPSNYMAEDECTRIIAAVPTTWDETLALEGKIAEYATLARRKGDTWWLGSINGWNARSSKLDLSFLPEGNWEVTLFQDGVNADRVGRDYKARTFVLEGRTIEVPCAPGGGFLMKITKK